MRKIISDIAPLAPRVTALPTSPVDGAECYFVADAVNACLWHLRYNTASAKWEFLGGAPLYSEIDPYIGTMGGPDRSVSGANYIALAVPLTLTLPVVGWYDIELGMGGYHGVQGQVSAMSYDIGTTPASDADAVGWQNALANMDVHRLWRLQRKQFVSAPLTLTAKFRTTTSGSAVFRGPKSIKATPVLLG